MVVITLAGLARVAQAEVRATPPLQPVAQLAKGFQVVSAMAMGIAVL